MLLEIDDWRTVSDLQYRFNKCFTNLQLLVFDATGKPGEQEPVPGGALLETVRKRHEPGVLSLKSWYTCNEAVQLLAQHYGLRVQIVPVMPVPQVKDRNCGQLTLQEFNALATPENYGTETGSLAQPEELEGW